MKRSGLWKFAAAIILLVSCGTATGQVIPGGKNLALAPTKATSQETQNGVNDSGTPPAQRNPRYKLCTSDSIALTFPLTPEFNQTIVIQPDGFVSLAGVGDVYLAGMTAEESVAAIEKAYTKILHDPIVTIELKDFNKPYFIVTGQVNKPGKYDLRGDISATQAVAIAGGFNDSAKHSQVLLFRRVNDDWYEVKPINLKKILTGRDLQEDIQVRPGDMLFVPQNMISKIKKFIPSTGVGTYYQLYQ
jgi:polysaccharide biosynthesis/export protein